MSESPKFPQGELPPKTWLLESIIATIFCCLPFGIIGIIYANQVERLYYGGKPLEAAKASKKAKVFCMITFFLGVLIYAIALIGYLMNFEYGS